MFPLELHPLVKTFNTHFVGKFGTSELVFALGFLDAFSMDPTGDS